MQEIRRATTAPEREAIYRLRYEIYAEELRLLAESADHENRLLRDASDERATLLFAETEGKVVGSLRIQSGADGPFCEETREAFDMGRFEDLVDGKDTWTLSRFLVREELRGGALPFRFVLAAAELAVEKGVELAFCDCEPHLLPLYTSLGFRTYRTVYNYASTGVVVPLVMITSDLEHIRQVGSPLREVLERRTRPTAIAARLRERLGGSPPVVGAEQLDRDDYQALVTGFRAERPELPPLFAGLEPCQVDRLLKRSHVIELAKGDHLIRRGQGSHTLYLVLEGALEVREEGLLVGIAHQGEALGEVAFLLGGPRLSDVSALAKVRVLALNDGGLRYLMETDSKVAARFLLYLSKCLCLKLCERSRGVGALSAPAAGAVVGTSVHSTGPT